VLRLEQNLREVSHKYIPVKSDTGRENAQKAKGRLSQHIKEQQTG
jgi:hypothetical protein